MTETVVFFHFFAIFSLVEQLLRPPSRDRSLPLDYSVEAVLRIANGAGVPVDYTYNNTLGNSYRIKVAFIVLKKQDKIMNCSNKD